MCVIRCRVLIGTGKTRILCNKHAGTNTIRHSELLFKLLTQQVIRQCIIAAWRWVAERNTHRTAPTDTANPAIKILAGYNCSSGRWGDVKRCYYNHQFVSRVPETHGLLEKCSVEVFIYFWVPPILVWWDLSFCQTGSESRIEMFFVLVHQVSLRTPNHQSSNKCSQCFKLVHLD